MSKKAGKESQFRPRVPFVRLGGGLGRDNKKGRGKEGEKEFSIPTARTCQTKK